MSAGRGGGDEAGSTEFGCFNNWFLLWTDVTIVFRRWVDAWHHRHTFTQDRSITVKTHL